MGIKISCQIKVISAQNERYDVWFTCERKMNRTNKIENTEHLLTASIVSPPLNMCPTTNTTLTV
jgi:hypothetical protein